MRKFTKEEREKMRSARLYMRRAIAKLNVVWPNESAMEKKLDDFCDELTDLLQDWSDDE